MICPHCSAEISDQAAFCGYCGAPVAEKKQGTVGQILFGIAFVLLGLVSYFVNPLLARSVSVVEMVAVSGTAVAALNIIYSVFSLALSLFYFSSAVLTVLAGVALLCGRSGAGKLALVGGIANAAAAVVSVAVTAAMYLMPELLVSLYAPQAEILDAAKQILRESTVMLPFLGRLFLRVGICSMLAAGGIVAFFVLRKKGTLGAKLDRGCAAMALSVPLLSLFRTISTTVISLLCGSASEVAMAGYSWASSLTPGIVLALLFLAVTVWALCSAKWKPAVRLLPAIGLVLTVLLITYVCGLISMTQQHIPDEMMSYTRTAFSVMSIGTAMMFVGYTFWVCAAAKGSIPAWLQLIVCLVLPVIYIFVAVFTVVGLRAALPLASLFTAGAMVVLAVVADQIASEKN